MFDKAIKYVAHLLLLAMILVPANSFAYGTDETEPEPLDEVGITLEGEVDGSTVYLEWTFEGDVPHGFKVLVSETNGELVYPPESDTDAHFVGDDMSFKEIYNSGSHFFRVCAYNGDGGNHGCSNVLTLDIEEGEELMENDVTEDGTMEDDVIMDEDEHSTAGIELGAAVTDEGLVLEWEVDGSVSKGQKVLFSKTDPNLTYPPAHGTRATFIHAEKKAICDSLCSCWAYCLCSYLCLQW